MSDDARERQRAPSVDDPARGAALHPRVPRPHGGDQVRRRGDARRGPARGLRHRRRPAQVRRPQPGDRPRRRPRDHRLHGAARAGGRASTRACGSPTPETVEVAKMVLLGKLNSDIVQRLNRHGQPAVGLSGEDGIAVRGRAGRQRRAGRLRRLDRAGRRRRPQPHRRRLHPGDRLRGLRPRRQLLQRQRRRGGRQGRRRARRLQGDLPHRRRGLARRPRRRGLADLARHGRARSRSGSAGSTAACGRSSQACVDAIRGGAQSPTSSTAASRTACCSSSSPTPASARW